MISAVLDMYNNQQLWEKYAAFGREYVKENYNKDMMKQVFKSIVG